MSKKNHGGKVLVWVTGLAAVAAVGLFIWIGQSLKPVSSDKNPTTFIIRKGEVVDQIGQNLKDKGLIRSVPAFKFTVMKNNLATKIQAGSFKLSPSMTPAEIAQQLTSGRQDIWVTLLEGWRREEIAQALETAFLDAGATFDQQAFILATKGQEGLLFPDTYLFPLDTSEEAVASLLINTLETKLTPQMKQDIAKQGKTEHQILTMASLIEREAKGAAARKVVSGILWNRINNDWPLQVDATLQYVKGYNTVHQSWWEPPLAADKDLNSPYNTYQNPGLPPGPICSPSLDSIQAAIYPTESDYWFYITDNDGIMRYAKTLDEHNQNVNTYLR